MGSPRVSIDLNSIDEDGETVVFLSDVTGGKLQVGYMATAYEPDDRLAGPARVASIREDLGIAFLQVNWRAMKRESGDSHAFRLVKHGWVTSASRSEAAEVSTRVARGGANDVVIRTSTVATG